VSPNPNSLQPGKGYNTSIPYGVDVGGSKGDGAASPSLAEFRGPEYVASPLLGQLNPALAVVSKPVTKQRGRPPLGKRKLRLSVTNATAVWLKKIPAGERGQTVENAIALVVDGIGIDGLERGLRDLRDFNIRLKQVLGYLKKSKTLSLERRTFVEACGSAAGRIIGKILVFSTTHVQKKPAKFPVDNQVTRKPGRVSSGKKTVKLSFSKAAAALLESIPVTIRGRTVETVMVMFLDGLGISGWERAFVELRDLSSRLQDLLSHLQKGEALSEEYRSIVEASAFTEIRKLGGILKL